MLEMNVSNISHHFSAGDDLLKSLVEHICGAIGEDLASTFNCAAARRSTSSAVVVAIVQDQ